MDLDIINIVIPNDLPVSVSDILHLFIKGENMRMN